MNPAVDKREGYPNRIQSIVEQPPRHKATSGVGPARHRPRYQVRPACDESVIATAVKKVEVWMGTFGDIFQDFEIHPNHEWLANIDFLYRRASLVLNACIKKT